MSLFDIFKSKMDNVFDGKKFAKEMLQGLQADTDEVNKVIANFNVLRSAGRELDAVNDGRTYLSDLAKCCVACEESELPRILSKFKRIASGINEEKFAKTLIDLTIEYLDLATKSEIDFFLKDLTQLYMTAGDLALKVPEWQEEAYRCFWMAAETRPPKGCTMPASARDKANAHNCAWHRCNEQIRLNTSNQAEWANRKAWHEAKRREYAPGHNWEAPSGI